LAGSITGTGKACRGGGAGSGAAMAAMRLADAGSPDESAALLCLAGEVATFVNVMLGLRMYVFFMIERLGCHWVVSPFNPT